MNTVFQAEVKDGTYKGNSYQFSLGKVIGLSVQHCLVEVESPQHIY